MSVEALRLMVRWYRRQGDVPSPQTRSELLTRFMETNQQGKPPFAVPQPTITGCRGLIVCKHCVSSARENLRADAKLK
jgi:hypothetical protein